MIKYGIRAANPTTATSMPRNLLLYAFSKKSDCDSRLCFFPRELNIELTPKGKLVYEYHKKLGLEEYRKYLKNLEQFTAEDFQKYITVLNVINRRTQSVLNDKKSTVY